MTIPHTEAIGAGAESLPGGSVSVPYPSGVVSGSLVLVPVWTVIDDEDVPAPTNWTLIHSAAAGSQWNFKLFVFARRATGVLSGSQTFTPNSTTYIIGRMHRIEDAATSGAYIEGATSVASANSGDVNMPSITSTVADCLAMAFAAVNLSQAIGNPTGASGGTWAEASQFSSAASAEFLVETAGLASAGTISGGTIDVTTNGWAISGFALLPAAPVAGAGAAAGAGAGAAVGASEIQAIGTAAGSGAATAVSQTGSIGAGAGAAAGSGAATGVGSTTFASAGTASGAGQANAVGQSTGAGSGAAAGTGAGAGVGAATTASAGASTGTGSATGVAPTVGTVYYVNSSDGNASDSNDGSTEFYQSGTTGPLLTVTAGLSKITEPGDELRIEGGIGGGTPYAPSDTGAIFLVITDGNYGNGTSAGHKTVRGWYNGGPCTWSQRPIISGENWSNGGAGFQAMTIRVEYWDFFDFVVEQWGVDGQFEEGAIEIRRDLANHLTFTRVDSNNNFNSGWGCGGTTGGDLSNITWTDCDAIDNVATSGAGNVDGFAFSFNVGAGCSFIRCRAIGNSDDGYDLFEAEEIVTMRGCWAAYNGNNGGDGNGFKIGGGSPAPSVNHYLFGNLAVGNDNSGIIHNDNPGSPEVYNCTAYGNLCNGSASAQFEFDFTANTAKLTNNVAWGLGGTDAVDAHANVTQTTNSWNGGVTISDADFQSVSITEAAMKAARNEDGSLPSLSGFLELVSGSDLIDAGTDVGEAYNGTAPDMGAFEFDSAASAGAAASTAAASGVGASTASAIGSTTATGAALGVGISTNAATGASASTAAVSATGAATEASIGTSGGLAAADATAEATAAAVGASTATADSTGVGASTFAAVGASAGAADAAAAAEAGEAVGASAATSAASGVGASTGAAAGASTATSAATSVGESTNAADGSSAATSAVSGQSSAAGTSPGDGSTDAVSAVSGVGASTVEVDGASAGTGTVAGVGAPLASAVASSGGVTSTAGTAAPLGSAAGTTAATAQASAVGKSTHAAVGSSAATAAAAAQTSAAGVSPGDGASDATAAVAGTGASTRAGTGASAASSAVAGAAAPIVAAIGASAATAEAQAVGTSVEGSVGASAATAVANAPSLTLKGGVGQSTASAAAAAVGQATHEAAAASAATATVQATGAATHAAVGSSAATGVIAGIGPPLYNDLEATITVTDALTDSVTVEEALTITSIAA